MLVGPRALAVSVGEPRRSRAHNVAHRNGFWAARSRVAGAGPKESLLVGPGELMRCGAEHALDDAPAGEYQLRARFGA